MKLYRNFTSQEEIDLEYNIALNVADREHWIEWYARKSAKVRDELDCVLDVRFGPTVDETIDIFPAKKPGAPVLVFVHGGYWVMFGNKDFSFVARGLVNRDITVAVVNYSLCPGVTINEITRQNRAAIAWLHREGPGFNADISRIFIAGHSAGGQQVAMLSETDWQGEYGLPKDIIKGGIPISGVFDLHPLRYSYLQPKLLLTHETILSQSPYLNIPSSGPPLLVTFGKDETEEFHRQSTDFLKAWHANGLQGELLIQEGKHHLSVIEGLAHGNSPLCNAVIDFIMRCEKGQDKGS